MLSRCLIVDELHDNIHKLLKERNLEYDYYPDISRAEIINSIANYNGLIIRSKTKVDQELIGESNLDYVARAGAGVDNLDETFLKAKGIEIFNAPEGNRDAVGEHTIGLILNLLHNLHKGNHQVKLKEWDREGNRGWELGSLTVGILGLGNSGLSVAKKLAGFGCKVIAYDKFLDPSQHPEYLVNLNQIFEETDILSLHIPLTDETKSLIDAQYLKRFKKSIYLINASRGEIAPLSQIKEGIEDGRIIKAALDVMECENFSMMSNQQHENFIWLKESGRVIFTPHVAGWSYESYARINEILVEKIGEFLDSRGIS